MNFDSAQIFLDSVGYEQYYCDVPLLEGLSHLLSLQRLKEKKKKKGQSHFLEISVMVNLTVRTTEKQRMMAILHGIFTLAFSLVLTK